MAKDIQANNDQAAYWNSASGRKWIEHESGLDAALSSILDHLLEHANLREGQSVIDVGCGTGASTISAAKLVGTSGRVEGADISPILIDRARQRANIDQVENVAFTVCDAQTHGFPTSHFDCLISRFGMMFFDTPTAAFSNISRSIRPGHRMVFAAWASVATNPWFGIPKRVAEELLGVPSKTDPKAPGPLAFQDIDYVTGLLTSAGLTGISAEELIIDLVPPGNAVDAASIASRVGPAARVMKEFGGTETDARAIEDGVATAFSGFLDSNKIRIPAKINMFSAICN